MGKPIIAYAIEKALGSDLFDEVMVSTDDDEIAAIAEQYGAHVPILRSKKNASDHATTADVLLEVLMFYKAKGVFFEYACCIYPTAPLIHVSNLEEAYDKLKTENLDAVIPVVEFDYPIQRAFKIQNDKLNMIASKHKNTRSQDLESCYHDCGQFYWFNSARLFKNKTLFTDNTGAIVINSMEVQDIDIESDWQLAELKYQLILNKNEYKNLVSV
ncbi:MAG: pseudaminic acid cytidylyltransferase [Paraglaciecola sp.]|jgi:pseudaminic acid cytidylyltransferase